ncbi:protein HAPLESS 2-like [Dorcoceras hygrometricum]|uniref:Protein HAPLESS 2-like n=1 Tax=Dorcoceras hygrometricum TaxID=472368 RepID=A0A2Z7BYE1_9LAMI|nr:protein HAPLESS 2-like [Dorcoceras hygrometricum]
MQTSSSTQIISGLRIRPCTKNSSDHSINLGLWRPLQLVVPTTAYGAHYSLQWSLQLVVVASALGDHFSSWWSFQLSVVTSACGGVTLMVQLSYGGSTQLMGINSA